MESLLEPSKTPHPCLSLEQESNKALKGETFSCITDDDVVNSATGIAAKALHCIRMGWTRKKTSTENAVKSGEVTKITRANIQQAVKAWCSDREAARNTYGCIEEWDTSAACDA